MAMDMRATYILKFRIEGAGEMRSDLSDIAKNLKDIAGTYTAKIKADVQKVTADQVMPAGTTNTILGRVKGIGAAFLNIKTLVAGIGAAVAAIGVAKLAEGFVNVGKGIMTTTESLKKMRLGMEGVYGDEAKAKMEWLLRASMDLPGTLEEFAAGALRIKAMGGLFGMDIEDMRDGKTLLEDLVKLAAIRPERGFLGMLDPATMWVFAEYDRSLRFAVGATKDLMSQISGISEEAMAGASIEATKNRMEALRAYISTISDKVLEKYKNMLTTAVGSFETIAKVGIESIGEDSGMYRSITNMINNINKAFEELQGSKVWDEITEAIGGPFRDLADKVSEGIDEAKRVLESGAGIEAAIGKFGDIVSDEIAKQSVKIGKAAYVVGRYIALPFVTGFGVGLARAWSESETGKLLAAVFDKLPGIAIPMKLLVELHKSDEKDRAWTMPEAEWAAKLKRLNALEEQLRFESKILEVAGPGPEIVEEMTVKGKAYFGELGPEYIEDMVSSGRALFGRMGSSIETMGKYMAGGKEIETIRGFGKYELGAVGGDMKAAGVNMMVAGVNMRQATMEFKDILTPAAIRREVTPTERPSIQEAELRNQFNRGYAIGPAWENETVRAMIARGESLKPPPLNAGGAISMTPVDFGGRPMLEQISAGVKALALSIERLDQTLIRAEEKVEAQHYEENGRSSVRYVQRSDVEELTSGAAQ